MKPAVVSVALTLDLYTPHEYVNYYGGRLGMLTLSVNGVLHRVGRVISTNKKVLATVVCRGFGFVGGDVLNGPWVKLHDGRYSTMESNCSGNEFAVEACSTELKIISRSAMMVDYFVCRERKYKRKHGYDHQRCEHSDFLRQIRQISHFQLTGSEDHRA